MAKISYCIKCKAKSEIMNAELTYFKNGTPAWKGRCGICGTRMGVMLSKEEKAEIQKRSLEGEK